MAGVGQVQNYPPQVSCVEENPRLDTARLDCGRIVKRTISQEPRELVLSLLYHCQEQWTEAKHAEIASYRCDCDIITAPFIS
ncbi:hypothetical protein J6590_009628 [Homalodisca vitripennis]|nr:hypothetical protein J6590_009628 [Homalodisca vitripennis]